MIRTTLALALFAASPAVACETTLATFYSYNRPRTTYNHEWFDPLAFTAASHTMPMNTLVLVTYQGRSVVVRINDRMPDNGCRRIDVTRGIARWLGFELAGVVPVTIAVVTAMPEYP